MRLGFDPVLFHELDDIAEAVADAAANFVVLDSAALKPFVAQSRKRPAGDPGYFLFIDVSLVVHSELFPPHFDTLKAGLMPNKKRHQGNFPKCLF